MMEKTHADWTITPLVGIGKLRFGMTPSQVADILGTDIKFTRPIEDGSINEIRRGGKLPVCNYRSDRLRCVDIYSINYDTNMNDIFLFQEDPQTVINRLEDMNGPPSVVYGICYFKNIGVSLGKWINPQTFTIKQKSSQDQDLRSVSISERGINFDIFTDDKIVSLRNNSNRY